MYNIMEEEDPYRHYRALEEMEAARHAQNQMIGMPRGHIRGPHGIESDVGLRQMLEERRVAGQERMDRLRVEQIARDMQAAQLVGLPRTIVGTNPIEITPEVIQQAEAVARAQNIRGPTAPMPPMIQRSITEPMQEGSETEEDEEIENRRRRRLQEDNERLLRRRQG